MSSAQTGPENDAVDESALPLSAPMLTISLPYRERAALAVISDAEMRGERYQVIGESNWLGFARWRLSSRRLANPQLGPWQLVPTVGALVRRASRVTRSRSHDLQGMHIAKALFDRAVSRRLKMASGVLIGFPGASRLSFRRFAGVRIFHAVDAHPAVHNEELLKHYPRAVCRAELYPRWLIARIERELELADVVLVPSKLVEQQMITHGVPSEKLVVQPYGVDYKLFAPRTEITVPREPRTRVQVVYVGQISRRKGIGFLVEAARDLELDVVLIGNTFDSSLLLGLPDNVSLRSSVSHQDLAKILAESDAFVVPTIEDACSLVALEAAASGLPVITTVMNGAAEILPRDIVKLTRAGDIAGLRDALLEVETLSSEVRIRNVQYAREGGIPDWSEYAGEITTLAASSLRVRGA